MPCGVAPRGSRLEFNPSQRKQFRRRQIPRPMLVVDGERFNRFTHDMRRAASRLDQSTPAGGGEFVTPLATRADGERP
jgi:hypothetical protein